MITNHDIATGKVSINDIISSAVISIRNNVELSLSRVRFLASYIPSWHNHDLNGGVWSRGTVLKYIAVSMAMGSIDVINCSFLVTICVGYWMHRGIVIQLHGKPTDSFHREIGGFNSAITFPRYIEIHINLCRLLVHETLPVTIRWSVISFSCAR